MRQHGEQEASGSTWCMGKEMTAGKLKETGGGEKERKAIRSQSEDLP